MQNNRTAIAVAIAFVVIIMCLVCTAAGLFLYLSMRNPSQTTITGNGAPAVQTPAANPPAAEPTEAWSIESVSMSKTTATATVQISYPQIKNFPTAAVQTSFNKQVVDAMNQISGEVLASPATGMGQPNSVNLDFTVAYKSDKFLSIAMQGSQYSGGAHPNALIYTFNYDLAANKKLVLADLFTTGSNYLDVISAFSIAELNTRGISDDSTVTGGAGPVASNYIYFDVAATGLGIEVIFPPYQVAAYAAGTQVVSVPSTVFSALLKSEYKSMFN